MKVLVIRFGAMGDLVHLSASFKAVLSQKPDIQLDLLTSSAYLSLVSGFEGLSRTWHWDKPDGLPALFRLARTLSAEKYDAVIHLHPSLKTYLFCWLLQVAQVAVYRKEKLTVFGETQRLMPRRHAVEDFYAVFQQALSLKSLDRTRLIPLLRLVGLNLPQESAQSQNAQPQLALIIGVGGKRGNRAWPEASYRDLLARLLTETPAQVLLIGGPAEAELANTLQAGMVTSLGVSYAVRVSNLCGQLSIPETARRLAGCAVVVGGDTGPLHLAAATGVPVIGLFGPTSVARTGALSSNNPVMITPESALSCWPCEKPVCPLSGEETLACMKSISVDQVFDACQHRLMSGADM